MNIVGKVKKKLGDYIDFSILQGAGIAFVIKVLGAAASFGLQIVLARLLSLEDYGSYTYIMAWVGVVSGFANLGFTTSIVRFIPEYLGEENYPKLKGILIQSILITISCSLLFAVLGIVLILVVPGIGKNINSASTIYSSVIGIFVGLALLNLFSSIEKGKKRMFVAFAPLQLFRKVFIGVGLFVLWFLNKEIDVRAALLCTVLTIVLLVIWHLLSLKKGIPEKVFQTNPSFFTREWLKISFPLLLINGFLLILNKTDIIMLGIFSTNAQVGIYNIAYKVAALVNFVLLAVNAIAAPTISELYHQNKMEELQQFAKNVAHLIFWPTLIISGCLILGSGFLLSLFGSEFIEGDVLLIILLIGQFINALVGPVGFYLNMTGHQLDSAKVYGSTALINIIFNPLGIYFFDAIGAAIVTSLTTGMLNIWLYFLVKRKIGIRSTFMNFQVFQSHF